MGIEAHHSIRLYSGDAIAVLKTLPAESAHCCITSPPYWGLRDYGTARWEGGDAECDHFAPARGGMGPASALQIQVKRLDITSGRKARRCFSRTTCRALARPHNGD